MDAQKIESIRKEHPHEWLVIEVVEMDDATTTPMTGQLLFHHPNREMAWQEAAMRKGLIMVISADDWPEDLAACFYEIV